MNIDRLRGLVEHIKEFPEEWDQTTYVGVASACGTACCLAGHAALAAGKHPGFSPSNTEPAYRDSRAVAVAASQYLGLTLHESCWLFSATRTLADFERVIETGRVT
jgi:hypothetical protein